MSGAPGERPVIGIVADDLEQFDALSEWVQAAGFEPVPFAADGVRPAAAIVRMPTATDPGAIAAPVVLLADPAHDVPPAWLARAADVVEQPDPNDVQSLLAWSHRLLEVLHRLASPPRPPTSCAAIVLGREELTRKAPELVAIGISTGGPEALKVLFQTISGHTLPPMVLVQHMPASFLGPLALRLQTTSGYRTKLAAHGDVLAAGTAYFAPGDRHVRVVGRDNGQLVAHLSEDPPVRGHRPAAEILFESCSALPIRGIGVLMTGMGQDGAAGLLALRQRGWTTLGQNAATCAIYGMPMAARALGAVEHELPLEEIGRWLVMLCRCARPVAAH
ncbi:MAG: CheB methylesterase domain-containing protein [Planctomycetota bacterium]